MKDGKRSPYEGGIRTPIMLRWPGKIQPGYHDEPVMSVDIAPTILAACGLKPGKDLQGVNLMDLLAGKIRREAVFGAAYEHNVMDLDNPSKSLLTRWVIDGGRWKLISGPGPRRELYDISADPHEAKNLVASQAKVVKRLQEKLDAWWKP
jgi:uncharacterized sulfatase